MATDLSPPGQDREPPRHRQKRRAPLIALAVAVPLVALVAVLGTRPAATTKPVRSPLVGRSVPVLQGTTLDDADLRLASRPGRWVLINFFATWCVPCRVEHPELVRFARRHAKTGDAEVIGVVFNDSTAAVRRFRATNGGSWPMLLDPDGTLAVRFGVARVPESYIVAPDGVVVAKLTGGVRDDELEQFLRAQGAEK